MLTEGIPAIPDIEEAIKQEVRAMGVEEVYRLLAEADPAMAAKIEKNDSQRITRAYEVLKQTGKSLLWWQGQEAIPAYPADNFRKFFLDIGREKNYQNCNDRFENMIKAGVLDEMKGLDAMGLNPLLPAMKAHGVPELLAYLHGEMTLEDAIAQAQQNTRHYIKRQFTWFRHQVKDVVVLNGDNPKDVILLTKR
jgi:tRNA dimethylallyltransferase